MDYAQKHGIEIDYRKQDKKSPYSMDANLLHTILNNIITTDTVCTCALI
jgi:argininosuccinate synthase